MTCANTLRAGMVTTKPHTCDPAQCTNSTRTCLLRSAVSCLDLKWFPLTCGLQPQCQEPQDGLFFLGPANSESAHHCGIHSQLSCPKQREAIHNHLEPASVCDPCWLAALSNENPLRQAPLLVRTMLGGGQTCPKGKTDNNKSNVPMPSIDNTVARSKFVKPWMAWQCTLCQLSLTTHVGNDC